MTTPESWLAIDLAPGYEVSSLGRVRSWRSKGPAGEPRILRPGVNPKGYPFVALQTPIGQRSLTLHRLVARAFLGPRPDGLVTRHIDGNQRNPAMSNLAYGTRSENELDKVEHGTHPQASRTHCIAGHAFNEENTKVYQGRRYCRTCTALRNAKRDRRGEKARLRAAREARQAEDLTDFGERLEAGAR